MPTLNKLEYLDETKQEIKSALNTNFNTGITDEDTFRSYVTKIDNIYTNWPKVTGEGTEITLSNTKKGRMPLEPKGNTEQDSYSGKNLFNYNIIDVETVTINDDGTILISDTESSNGYTTTYKNLSQLCPSLQVGDTVYLYIESDWTLRQYIYSSALGNWSNGQSRTITQEMLDGRVILYGGYQTTSHLKIMITNQLETSFEPYVGGTPSPNPDYPQDIRVVKGNNTIKVTGKNLLQITNSSTTVNGVTFTINNDGTVLANGIATDEINFSMTVVPHTNLDLNTNYILTGSPNTASQTTYRLMGACIRGDDTTSYIADNTGSGVNIPASKNIRVYINIKSGVTVNNLVFKPMVRLASITDDTYQLYQEQTYPLNLDNIDVIDEAGINPETINIELCKIGDNQDIFFKQHNKWHYAKYIGKYVYNNDLKGNGITSTDIAFLTPSLNIDASISSLLNKAFCNLLTATIINSDGLNGTTSTNKIRLNFSTKHGNSYSDIETLCTNKNLTIYYVLATPVDYTIEDATLIGQLEALYNAMSVDGTNIITSTYEEGNAPVIINATALMKGGN